RPCLNQTPSDRFTGVGSLSPTRLTAAHGSIQVKPQKSYASQRRRCATGRTRGIITQLQLAPGDHRRYLREELEVIAEITAKVHKPPLWFLKNHIVNATKQ